jgi:Protein of unknown function (DUF3800)
MLVHPKDGHPKVFCVLEAYLDDSGTHSNSTICVVAGYFGGEHRWTKFDREWRRELDSQGIKEFHANRFWGRENGKMFGEYEGWSNERASKFLSKLLAIINSHRIYPIGAAVLMSEWEKLTDDEKNYLTGAAYVSGKYALGGAKKKSYFLPFTWAIRCVESHCNEGQRVHFFFDSSNFFSSYALEYYRLIKEISPNRRDKLGDIDFPDSHSATPIQAADLLAYRINRYATKKFSGKYRNVKPDNTLRSAIAREKPGRLNFPLFDKASLDKALVEFRQELKR